MIIFFKAESCKKCPFRIAEYNEDVCSLYHIGAKFTNKASLRETPQDCPFNEVSEITIKAQQ